MLTLQIQKHNHRYDKQNQRLIGGNQPIESSK